MKQTKRILCLILALIFCLFSMVACNNEKYQQQLDELAASVAALKVEMEQYQSDAEVFAQLEAKIAELEANIAETKPRGKDFEENLSALKQELASCKDSYYTEKQKENAQKLAAFATESAEVTNYVILTVENYGSMVIELYPDTAPITVANFQKLVSEKFYDGLIFHRIIENFMIQGGDPLGTGTGGSKDKIKGEFSKNGIKNDLKHTNGVISMARSSSMNSASSQFFICQGTQKHLDGQYAAFGQVIYGLELIDEIAAVKTDAKDKPLTPVVITSIRFATLVK